MWRRILGATLILMVMTATGAQAQTMIITAARTQAQSYEFKLGFKALADQISDTVGVPLENEHFGANGDSLQRTSNGLMVWRKSDNFTCFTNGSRSWINGPFGLQERDNNERFDWEASQQASPPTSPTPAPSVAPRPTSIPIPAIPTIGQRIESNGAVFLVNGVRRASSIGRLHTAPTGKVYLIVDVTVQNASRAKLYRNPFDFKVKGSDAVEIEPDVASYALERQFKSGDLLQGDTVRGELAFLINTNAQGLVLYYEMDFDTILRVKLS